MNRPALKLLKSDGINSEASDILSDPDYLNEIESCQDERNYLYIDSGTAASANQLQFGVEGITAELANYLARKYLVKGKTFLDANGSNGNFAYECQIKNLNGIVFDDNKFSVNSIKAKLSNTGLTEVALRLQNINLKKPVSIEVFKNYLSPFFDIDTYTEIVSIRDEIKRNPDPVNSFIGYIVANILHGTSSGCLTSYTNSQVALTPHEQTALNYKRGQFPDYRALPPRILRKTALALRDSNGLSLSKQPSIRVSYLDDQRDMSSVASSSINFALTAPFLKYNKKKNWLREWFISGEKSPETFLHNGLNDTHDKFIDPATYINELLFELARVTEQGGTAAVCLKIPAIMPADKLNVCEREVVLEVLRTELKKYWAPLKILRQKDESNRQENILKAKLSASKPLSSWEAIIIKRL